MTPRPAPDIERSSLHRRNGQLGFTLVEGLVSFGLSLLILGAVYPVLLSQQVTYGETSAVLDALQAARAGMQVLQSDLRHIGAGFPTDPAIPLPAAHLKIQNATATSLSYYADLLGVSTTLTGNVAAGTATLPVTQTAGFRAGDVIWLINQGAFEPATVVAAGATGLTIAGGVAAAYPQGTEVGRSRLIAYAVTTNTPSNHPCGPITNSGLLPTCITRDAGDGRGSQPIIWNIVPAAVTLFTYYDVNNAVITPPFTNAQLGQIRRIMVQFTVQGQMSARTQQVTLRSDVRPQNLF
jgi:type II secretory pathway pseudopilin PulG